MATYGGEFPDIGYGAEMTVEGPATLGGVAISATNPVNQGTIWKLAIAAATATDGSGYKLVECAAGDDFLDSYLVLAKHRHIDPTGPMGVKVLSGHAHAQIRELPYHSGTAPTIGQSVEISDAGVAGDLQKVKGIAHAIGKGLVLKLDTTRKICEVLL